METDIQQDQKDLVSKGKLDFSNSMINFIQVHASLLAYATKLNMNTIMDNSNELLKEIKGIDVVTTKINQISLKTRILSINALIEAARAGSAGSGFAVVAEEVGNLSDQTTKCTKEVDDVNRVIIDEAKNNSEIITKVQLELSKFTSSSEALSQEISSKIKVEENNFIITLLAKRLENHADFIRNLMQNAGKIENVVDHHNCALGKWYDANKTKYASIPEFVSLYATHENFHSTAKIFNETLKVEHILKLVDISHEILNKFIALTNVFEQLVQSDDTYFDI